MIELTKTNCDWTFAGWPDRDMIVHWTVADSVIDCDDPDRPKPARPQRMLIDLEKHSDYLEAR
jgi:hypothetical protein